MDRTSLRILPGGQLHTSNSPPHGCTASGVASRQPGPWYPCESRPGREKPCAGRPGVTVQVSLRARPCVLRGVGVSTRTGHSGPPMASEAQAWRRQAVHWNSARTPWSTMLTRYLEDPALPIDNNHDEQQIRPWSTGRKNWLFAGTLLAVPARGCHHKPDPVSQAQRPRPVRLPQGRAHSAAYAAGQPHRGAAAPPLASSQLSAAAADAVASST